MKQRIFVAIALGGVVAVCLGLKVFERARAPIRTNSDSVSDFAEPPEPTALAESFLDVSAAISLDNHSRRSPIDQTVPRLEIVKVPLRHFSSVPHDGSVCLDVHSQIDHLLLLVRRAKNDSLSEAGVIGFLRLQSSVTGLMCGTVIESADPSIAYVVLAKKVDDGLNPIVCAVDYSLGDSCKVGDLNSLKPSLWPNGLRIVSQPREPIRFRSQFNAIVTGSYVQDGSDCRIEMEFRDGSGCGRLAGYSYSFQTDEWVALQNRGIWKLDDGSTEVIHVLPVDHGSAIEWAGPRALDVAWPSFDKCTDTKAPSESVWSLYRLPFGSSNVTRTAISIAR